MTEVIVTPRARADISDAIPTLGLPPDTWKRVTRSLRLLEDFPLAGRELGGRWGQTRFLLGPWPWMILLYRYEPDAARVYVVAMHDGRSSAAARPSSE